MKINEGINAFFNRMGDSAPDARKQRRIVEVRERYKGVLESVYQDDAPLFLAHTNAVYILKKEGEKQLVVYVDESIFAAELNAQRELIRLKLLELYGERVDCFDIYTSRGALRKAYPYRNATSPFDGVVRPERHQIKSLTDYEEQKVEEAAAAVSDERLRKALRNAMEADLKWKKSESGEN